MNTPIARKVSLWQKLNGTNVLAVFLSIYVFWVLVLITPDAPWAVLTLIVMSISGLGFWFLGQKLTGKKKDWKTLLISLSIVFLIWHYGVGWQDWPWAIVVMFGVMLAKFSLYYRGISLINPAVCGLFLGTLAVAIGEQFWPETGAFVSWWGVNVGGMAMLIFILAWLIVGGIKFRKYYLLLSFLLSYAVLLFITGKVELLQFTFTDATIYFWAGVMLIEPKTSPSLPKQQLLSGVVAAMLLLLLNDWQISFAELWTLLAVGGMNVYFRLSLAKKPS